MIYPIGRLWCEGCCAERLFVVLADAGSQVDPHGCECDVCGYTFGDRGYVVIEEVRAGQRVPITKPVIDPAVLAAARDAYRVEAATRLLELGSSKAKAAAEMQLAAALDEPDLTKRRALMPANPQALDPKLAQRVLDPRNRSRPGAVE